MYFHGLGEDVVVGTTGTLGDTMEFDWKIALAAIVIICSTVLFALSKIDFTQFMTLINLAIGLINVSYVAKISKLIVK